MASGGSGANGTPAGGLSFGMTKEQHLVLKNQIQAARLFQFSVRKNIPIPLPKEWLPHLQPPPLRHVGSGHGDISSAGGVVTSSGTNSHGRQERYDATTGISSHYSVAGELTSQNSTAPPRPRIISLDGKAAELVASLKSRLQQQLQKRQWQEEQQRKNSQSLAVASTMQKIQHEGQQQQKEQLHVQSASQAVVQQRETPNSNVNSAERRTNQDTHVVRPNVGMTTQTCDKDDVAATQKEQETQPTKVEDAPSKPKNAVNVDDSVKKSFQKAVPRPLASQARIQPLFVIEESPLEDEDDNKPIFKNNELRQHTISQDMLANTIRMEYERRTRGSLSMRMSLLESILADPKSAPGMKWKDNRPPYGLALLQLRMLRTLAKQRDLKNQIDNEGLRIYNMGDKEYNKMRKRHLNARTDAVRKEEDSQRDIGAAWAREVKSYKSDVMGVYCGALRDLRVTRNRLVVRAHERLGRERLRAAAKDDQAARMAALKAHDFEAYQEMLKSQTGGIPAGGERYEAISKFLADTEAYLHRLAGKIAAVKASAEASSAAAQAMADARARGLSEEEAQAAARLAAAEAATGSEALHEAVGGSGDAQSRYYALAHSSQEEITDQPTLLRPPGNAKLREYQIVGLQWMVSLYNNHLNGILADEMGLGKTVQVMALLAYLMEKKKNFGPHLIIVPNAVIVNWKSELTQWLPSARCVYYVGAKEERNKRYATEVQPLQFNILVTTYEFIMRDRTKLSKIDWQYIIIDEAQRMKDRQSKLAKDLDRFRAARRLLLSGTPLQNDLQELWSLLNLLLPDVFDDKKVFAEWFGEAIASSGGNGADGIDWLEKEKRVVVIHRLHQILEPFMLRRQVEDVETKLPPKVTHTIRVPMSSHQSCVYSWVKATGTIRLDPHAPTVGKYRRTWASLQNKCMELRKLCNHPLLSYPPAHWSVGPAVVRQCGKMVVLDRMLVKLKAAGHRVLLFSTMTKLLDLLEVYFQWRNLPESLGGGRMKYLRIDGSTLLEDRETAIQEFNSPNSDAFIFLLSIRAAGRGLNLQSSDTVIIYDPDPNPKNEEQAIARSHRIGQTKEVRVFHLEAVTDGALNGKPVFEDIQTTMENQTRSHPGALNAEGKPLDNSSQEIGIQNGGASSYNSIRKDSNQGKIMEPTNTTFSSLRKENEGITYANTSSIENVEEGPAGPVPKGRGRRLFGDSIESIMRGQIQKMKIEMANEVIDAGRFDQQTSMEERRQTLETLLHDQHQAKAATNTVPSWVELNRMLARGQHELDLFENLDKQTDIWFDLTTPDEVPNWMRWDEMDLRAAMEENAKHHRVDMEAEMAALMGTVLHHHHPPSHREQEKKGTDMEGMQSGSFKRGATAAYAEPEEDRKKRRRIESSISLGITETEGDEEDEDVETMDNDEEEEYLDENLEIDEDDL